MGRWSMVVVVAVVVVMMREMAMLEVKDEIFKKRRGIYPCRPDQM